MGELLDWITELQLQLRFCGPLAMSPESYALRLLFRQGLLAVSPESALYGYSYGYRYQFVSSRVDTSAAADQITEFGFWLRFMVFVILRFCYSFLWVLC